MAQAAALALVFAVVGAASAEPTGAARFKEIDGAIGTPDASRLLSARMDKPVQMVVVMSEPSVAEARAATVTKRINQGEKDAVRQRVHAQHDTVRPQLEGHGIAVSRQFHGALNGLKVELRPSQLAAVRALPGVVKVVPVLTHQRDNASGVPYIGAPAVWEGLSGLGRVRGEGVKIAVIDTGIDYTHANFGGPGTPAAFDAAAANSTAPADPALFGPDAPKVKGGIDLVGDAYNGYNIPVPDLNPLDCRFAGHGSHVAGTTAGFGVTQTGATYHGPYTAAAYATNPFKIGPGVAPKAELYAVRVFGCTGSTNVVLDAIEWAVDNDMDVINMSLGSSFGTADSADALAATAATKAGVVVVASAGNAGPNPYISGAPASGDGVISVAAIDGRPSFPGATLTLAGGASISAQDSNGAALPAGPLVVVVLRNADGTVSLGCNAAEYAGTAGKLVVTLRGSCARVDRATFGQAAGAAAVAMINNGAGFGIFEGAIPGVTIPFLGIQPSDAAALVGAPNVTALASVTLANAFLGTAASFSSGGPRFGDSKLKPSVAAPGVSVFSTMVATGNGTEALSGTSMASPHVAGVAALTVQAHPSWTPAEISAAIVQTADPSKLSDYIARVEGAGLVQPASAAQTQAIVSVHGDPTATAVSFGFAEFTRDFKASRTITVENKGRHNLMFNVAAVPTGGRPHSLTLGRSTVTVHPGHSADVDVKLDVPIATAGDSSDFREVAGLITLTPTTSTQNGGVALHVPYYLVPRARSALTAELDNDGGALSVKLSNREGKVNAYADFYALGLAGGTPDVAAPFDLRAVGVQSFPVSATQNVLVFAVNTFHRFSTAAAGEVDIYLDVDGDGWWDFVAYSYDYGKLTTGTFSGQAVVAVVNLWTGATKLRYFTDAATDGSTLLMPVLSSDIGLSVSNPRISYQAYAWNWNGDFATLPGTGLFNAFAPAVSNGDWAPVAPGGRASVSVTVNAVEQAITPALGVMVVNKENRAGAAQAALLRLNRHDD
jgi:subtilisin family serine protease